MMKEWVGRRRLIPKHPDTPATLEKCGLRAATICRYRTVAHGGRLQIMAVRRFLRSVALVALASTILYAPSCSSDKTTPATDEGDPALADVVYVGGTTDEALDQLLAADTDPWDWAGGLFDMPANHAVLPAATPATFAWHVDSSAPQGGGAGAGGASGALTPADSGVRWASLLQLFGPERTASAHGAPLNGEAFFLVFSTPSSPTLLRVFTTQLSYTPDADAWKKLIGAGGPITLDITSGIFENNLLTQDGGPHLGQTLTFTVQ